MSAISGCIISTEFQMLMTMSLSVLDLQFILLKRCKTMTSVLETDVVNFPSTHEAFELKTSCP